MIWHVAPTQGSPPPPPQPRCWLPPTPPPPPPPPQFVLNGLPVPVNYIMGAQPQSPVYAQNPQAQAMYAMQRATVPPIPPVQTLPQQAPSSNRPIPALAPMMIMLHRGCIYQALEAATLHPRIRGNPILLHRRCIHQALEVKTFHPRIPQNIVNLHLRVVRGNPILLHRRCIHHALEVTTIHPRIPQNIVHLHLRVVRRNPIMFYRGCIHHALEALEAATLHPRIRGNPILLHRKCIHQALEAATFHPRIRGNPILLHRGCIHHALEVTTFHPKIPQNIVHLHLRVVRGNPILLHRRCIHQALEAATLHPRIRGNPILLHRGCIHQALEAATLHPRIRGNPILLHRGCIHQALEAATLHPRIRGNPILFYRGCIHQALEAATFHPRIRGNAILLHRGCIHQALEAATLHSRIRGNPILLHRGCIHHALEVTTFHPKIPQNIVYLHLLVVRGNPILLHLRCIHQALEAATLHPRIRGNADPAPSQMRSPCAGRHNLPSQNLSTHRLSVTYAWYGGNPILLQCDSDPAHHVHVMVEPELKNMQQSKIQSADTTPEAKTEEAPTITAHPEPIDEAHAINSLPEQVPKPTDTSASRPPVKEAMLDAICANMKALRISASPKSNIPRNPKVNMNHWPPLESSIRKKKAAKKDNAQLKRRFPKLVTVISFNSNDRPPKSHTAAQERQLAANSDRQSGLVNSSNSHANNHMMRQKSGGQKTPETDSKRRSMATEKRNYDPPSMDTKKRSYDQVMEQNPQRNLVLRNNSPRSPAASQSVPVVVEKRNIPDNVSKPPVVKKPLRPNNVQPKKPLDELKTLGSNMFDLLVEPDMEDDNDENTFEQDKPDADDVSPPKRSNSQKEKRRFKKQKTALEKQIKLTKLAEKEAKRVEKAKEKAKNANAENALAAIQSNQTQSANESVSGGTLGNFAQETIFFHQLPDVVGTPPPSQPRSCPSPSVARSEVNSKQRTMKKPTKLSTFLAAVTNATLKKKTQAGINKDLPTQTCTDPAAGVPLRSNASDAELKLAMPVSKPDAGVPLRSNASDAVLKLKMPVSKPAAVAPLRSNPSNAVIKLKIPLSKPAAGVPLRSYATDPIFKATNPISDPLAQPSLLLPHRVSKATSMTKDNFERNRDVVRSSRSPPSLKIDMTKRNADKLATASSSSSGTAPAHPQNNSWKFDVRPGKVVSLPLLKNAEDPNRGEIQEPIVTSEPGQNPPEESTTRIHRKPQED
ncbi:GM22539 [Drosophila sechellia]|uniref:GM22539 n=1 Tax=Drosophila sechellia TaxID=7238 RepID=B4IKA1_DROSE|nr:GM22539 [Drosophila sechellia]